VVKVAKGCDEWESVGGWVHIELSKRSVYYSYMTQKGLIALAEIGWIEMRQSL